MTTLTPLVDTHAHLMDPAYAHDLADALARAEAAGVGPLLCVGYDLPTSEAAVRLARQHPHRLRAAVGIHPNSAGAAPDADFVALERLAAESEVVAIGETGLDYYRHHTEPARQREAFTWHLRLAEARGLPVVVHNREADADVAPLLEASAGRRQGPGAPGVLHCFSSADPSYLDRMVSAGYFVSFAGTLTFGSAGDLRSQAARVPEERLLVETDCPYLAPVPHRGRRNEPAYVHATAERLAEVRGVSFDSLSRRLWTNTSHVFPAFSALLPAGEPRP